MKIHPQKMTYKTYGRIIVRSETAARRVEELIERLEFPPKFAPQEGGSES